MCKNLFELKCIYILLLLFSIVGCLENNNEVKSEHKLENYNNESKSNSSLNKSVDYDYSEFNEEEGSYDCIERSFTHKLIAIHEEHRNSTLSRNVKHINETIHIIKNVQKLFGSLFEIENRDKLQLLEYWSEVDLGLSQQCLASFLRIVNGVRAADLWALKCKSI